jgi:hypothetical protein
MKTYKGFIYSKLGAMCSKGERAIYYLQTNDKQEYRVTTENAPQWGENSKLQPFVAHKVEIEGEIEDTLSEMAGENVIMVKNIKKWNCGLK